MFPIAYPDSHRLSRWWAAPVTHPLRKLLMAFAISRLLLFIPHVNFRWQFGTTVMHLLDPAWVTPENLILMPGQPPGWQLMVLAFGNPWLGFPLFTALGAAMMLALFRTMELLGIRQRVAAGMAFAFAMSPVFILAEREFFYLFPIMAAISGALFFFARGGRDGQPLDWLAGFACLAVPCWLHGFFHPVFVLGVGAFMLAAAQGPGRRRIALALLLPLAVAGLPALKNGVLYGVWAASTWAPFSLANVLYPTLDDRKGLLAYPPFHTNLDAYPLRAAITGNPMFDDIRRADGMANWHNLSAVPVGKALLRDDIAAIKAHPAAYWRGVQGALYFFGQNPSSWFWTKNKDRLGWYDKVWSFTTTGSVNPDEPLYSRFRVGLGTGTLEMPKTLWGWGTLFGWHRFPWLSFLILPLLAGVGLRRAWQSLGTPAAPAWTAMVAIAGYVTLLSLTMELGENMRFKAYMLPVLVVWLAALWKPSAR